MTRPSTQEALAERAARIIISSQYLALATSRPDTGPWSAQLQYAWFTSPLRFVVGSGLNARHTQDVMATRVAAASISTNPDSPLGLDGLQLSGQCAPLTGQQLTDAASAFYDQMFTDPQDAQAHTLPLEALEGNGTQRLLELTVSELWILDLDRWAAEGVSARRQVDIRAVEEALHGRRTSVRY